MKRPRAVRPADRPVQTPVANDYHVYADGLVQVLGSPVLEKNGNRVVRLHPRQAQYFIDNGLIGSKPLDKLSASSRLSLHQFSGGRVKLKDEKKPEERKPQTPPPQAGQPEGKRKGA